MTDQVHAGYVKRGNGGKIKEYPGDEPESRFPIQVHGLAASKQLPVPDQAGNDDDDIFQDDAYDINIFSNIYLHRINYEKNIKQHQQSDNQPFYQGRPDDQQEEPGEHEQFKRRIEVIYGKCDISLMVPKGLVPEQRLYILVCEKLHDCGYEQIDREYSQIGGIMTTVAVKYSYEQG